jgi:hypothetical protein
MGASAAVAFGTDYTDMFMRAAAALEERAAKLAFQDSDIAPSDAEAINLHGHVDHRC